MSFKPLFSRALSLNPGRLHFAAHSHHLWPDVTFEAHSQAWTDAMQHADHKWDVIFGEVIPEAQKHIAKELGLASPDTLVFAPSTHDLLLRIASGAEARPIRILSTDGEFHSFRRQAERWEEAGQARVERIALVPFETFSERLLEAARQGAYDLILTSQVFFRTGGVFEALEALADLARPEGPWVIIDGYHGFMARPTNLSSVCDRIFYLSGGYKYAMAGEGVCFLHAPAGYCTRPVITGWFAEFGDLEGPPGGVRYRTDAGRFWGATFDPSPFYRFNAVRRMLDEAGLETADVSAHAHGLQLQFVQAWSEGRCGPLGDATLLNPPGETGHGARFLAFRHDHASAWRAALLERNVITDVRDDVLRFGFGLYQDRTDVDALIAACREMS